MKKGMTKGVAAAFLVNPARLTVSLMGCWMIDLVSPMRLVLSSFVFVTVLQPLAAADETPQLVVRQGDFVKNLTFSGDLTTESVLTVMVPRISGTSSFVISYLALQGTIVGKGDLLVQLDAPELSTERLVLERQREDARTQVAQKEADLEAHYQDLLLILEIAKSQKEKASLFTQIDPALIPRADVEQYQFDFDQTAIRVEKAGKSLETFKKSRESELAVVRLEREQADLQFKRLSLELRKLTIRAPNPGLVIHDNNPMREGQFQIGDMVWTGLNLLYLPDMQNPRVRAYVYDEDFPLLKEGMKAQVTFDGLPHKIFEGRVGQLPSMARPREFHTLLTAFPVEISLQVGDDDVGLLRPGGTARVLVPVVQQNALVIPRAALRLDPDGSVFVRTQAAPDLSIPVQVLDASRAEVSISGDVQPGERLLRIETAASASAHSEIKWIPVKRQDLTFSISGSGHIRAEKAVTITAPLLEGHGRFEITYLAAEGVAVEKGELLIAFDASQKETRLRQEIAQLKKVQEEARQTEATLRLQVQQLEMQLEEAGAELTRMETKLQQARQFESGLIIIEARLDAELGRKKVELLTQKLRSVRKRVELQIKTVHDRASLHQRRVARQRDDIEALSVKAPISGVVVYSTNSKNQKKQVGSEVRRFGQVLELPDLTTLVVQGQVAEVDSGRIRIGQEVEIRLEGVPNQIFSGRIADLGKIFNRISYERPGRVLKIKIELDHSGNPRVRHGMAARFLVISERFENVLALPLTSIQLLADTPYVWVKGERGPEKRRVEIGTTNQLGAVVLSGLEEGEEVAGRPLEPVSTTLTAP